MTFLRPLCASIIGLVYCSEIAFRNSQNTIKTWLCSMNNASIIRTIKYIKRNAILLLFYFSRTLRGPFFFIYYEEVHNLKVKTVFEGIPWTAGLPIAVPPRISLCLAVLATLRAAKVPIKWGEFECTQLRETQKLKRADRHLETLTSDQRSKKTNRPILNKCITAWKSVIIRSTFREENLAGAVCAG